MSSYNTVLTNHSPPQPVTIRITYHTFTSDNTEINLALG